MDMFCIVCKTETKKYKCPRCREFYCSVNCFKTHKEQDCQEKLSPEPEPVKIDYRQIIPFKTEDTVPHEKLQELKNCESLKNLLYNRHLRALLKEIDEAPNARKAMKAAMQEPLFVEFADECLKIVEEEEMNS